jgi:type II secretory pathway pseudopilin PulG
MIFLGIVGLGFVMALCLRSFLDDYHKSVDQKRERNALVAISMALNAYHERYGSYPPPTIQYDLRAGKHSWRALIEDELISVCGGSAPSGTPYSFDQKWDSKANLRAASRHPLSHSQYRFYAIVGREAAWSSEGLLATSAITDGTANTITIVGIPGDENPWYEPTDIVFDGKNLCFSRNGEVTNISLANCFVLTADGIVRYIDLAIPDDVVRAIVTPAAGDQVIDGWIK